MTINLNTPRLDDGTPLTEADIGIRASWPVPHLHLANPIAAEACTDVSELPADHEYDWPRTARDRRHAARFWNAYVAAALVAAAWAVSYFMPN